MSDVKFTTLLVDLPSRGRLYSPESPLSEGTVELKYGSTQEENILTNIQYITKKIVIDKLIEALLVNNSIQLDDIVIGDMNALTIAARRSMYGDIYKANIICPRCNEKEQIEINLNELKHFKLSDNVTENLFTFKSSFEKIFKYHILTRKEEKEIELTQKRMKKMNLSATDKNMTLRLKTSIDSINNETDPVKLTNIIENMRSIESKELRQDILKNTPDVDNSAVFNCSNCEYDDVATFNLDVDFFWEAGRR